MSGIYLHIPFCKKACSYCNFHFSTTLNLRGEMVQAMLEEISMVKALNYLEDEFIQTVYLGGGTPSLLTSNELQSILETITKTFQLTASPEITLETNPDDITPSRLQEWKTAGVNRLSIGIQSFFEDDLRLMNRAHNASQALQCIRDAKAAGFDNFSIDLIYGGQGMTDEKWAANVETAINEQIPHLSCYALTVEPKTAMDTMIRKHLVPDVDSETQAAQFLYLMHRLHSAGYEHYEISNFSLPGMRSRHNTSYWLGKHYAGIGPSAHSFNGSSRQWNIANNALYIQSINKGLIPFEKETLTPTQQENEYIMTALRTSEGINLQRVSEDFGHHAAKRLTKSVSAYVAGKKVTIIDNRIVLTQQGKLFADGIASDLFAEEPNG